MQKKKQTNKQNKTENDSQTFPSQGTYNHASKDRINNGDVFVTANWI